MASISTSSRGGRRILFVKPDGSRWCIRMGRTPLKSVETVRVHIEAILVAQGTQANVDQKTADWLGKIDVWLHRKLVLHGLAAPRAGDTVVTLGPFIEQWIAKRADV